jgi:hypothetical protein
MRQSMEVNYVYPDRNIYHFRGEVKVSAPGDTTVTADS